jgi:hypothetical protein
VEKKETGKVNLMKTFYCRIVVSRIKKICGVRTISRYSSSKFRNSSKAFGKRFEFKSS